MGETDGCSRFLELRTLNFERRIVLFSRVSLFPPVPRVQSFSPAYLGEVFRQCDLNLVSFDPDRTTGDGDARILRSFAG